MQGKALTDDIKSQVDAQNVKIELRAGASKFIKVVQEDIGLC